MIDKSFFVSRPLSWTSISSFEFDPSQWHRKYIEGIKDPENAEMIFGKKFAYSCEIGKPMAPVRLLSKVEYPLAVVFNGIKLIGFVDTYEPHKELGEFKTAKKLWTQDKVDNHGQLDMYALMLHIQHQVNPDKMKFYLECVQTKENGDFTIGFAESPPVVHTFKTKRTMSDIIRFGARINSTVNQMIEYANQKEKDLVSSIPERESSVQSA